MRVLVVDPAPSTRSDLTAVLRDAGHEAVEAETPRQALQLLAAGAIHAVVCDEYLPGPRCIDLVRDVLCQRQLPALAVLDTAATLAGSMFSSGARSRLSKPVQRGDLLAALHEATLPASC
jgi:CheY-like chemotaxis protein